MFCCTEWDVSHMRESGVNLVQSSFSHSLVYNRVSKYMGHSEDSIAGSNNYLYTAASCSWQVMSTKSFGMSLWLVVRF